MAYSLAYAVAAVLSKEIGITVLGSMVLYDLLDLMLPVAAPELPAGAAAQGGDDASASGRSSAPKRKPAALTATRLKQVRQALRRPAGSGASVPGGVA